LSIKPGSPFYPETRTFSETTELPPKYSKPKIPRPPRVYPNPIARAREWKARLTSGVNQISQNMLAGILGVNRARVTQMLNLLALPLKQQEEILALGDTLTWPSITERQLRPLLVLSGAEQARAVRKLLARFKTEASDVESPRLLS
jgi:hypothetical protein